MPLLERYPMTNPEQRHKELLEEAGAILERQDGPHYVYRLRNGKAYVVSRTPSDRRVWLNACTILRNLAGLERVKGNGVRRDRKPKRKRSEQHFEFNKEARAGRTLKDQLKGLRIA